MSRKKYMPKNGTEFMKGKGFAGRLEAMGRAISEQVTKAAQAAKRKAEAATVRDEKTEDES
jgi:hypothetical protein